MKQRFRFFIITFFIIITHCGEAMEKNIISQTPILRQLIAKSECPSAKFLTNDCVIMKDNSECRIINPITNVTVKTITRPNSPFINFALHPNKKIFALFYDNNITIYDSQGNEKHSTTIDCPSSISAYFSPSDDTLLIYYYGAHVMLQHNYVTNQTISTNLLTHHNRFPIVKFKPINHQLCMGYDTGDLFIYNHNNYTRIKKIANKYPLHFIEYSPNGDFIATANNNAYGIINTISHDYKWEISGIKNLQAIAFHPNNKILATLSQENNPVCYVDIVHHEVIATMSPLYSKSPIINFNNNALSFSPDGKKLMVALLGSCVITEVPFEVLYLSNTKKIIPYILCILKKYTAASYNNFPADIIGLLLHNLLAVFKR